MLQWFISGPVAALAPELTHWLKQIQALPSLKVFRHEYRVPCSVNAPHNKSRGYKFCCASRLNVCFEWRQTGWSWSSYSFDWPQLYHSILLRALVLSRVQSELMGCYSGVQCGRAVWPRPVWGQHNSDLHA